jgi:hypothetical protein
MVKHLKALAATGQPGQAITYYRGFLIKDRTGNHELGDIADTALQLAAAGQLLLFQRRHGPDDYSYIAYRATPPLLKFIAQCAASAEVAS